MKSKDINLWDILWISLLGAFCLFAPPSNAGSIPECGMDVNIVYQARKNGTPKEALVARATQAENLTEERRAFILKLIDEAYSKSAQDFGDDAFPACGSSV